MRHRLRPIGAVLLGLLAARGAQGGPSGSKPAQSEPFGPHLPGAPPPPPPSASASGDPGAPPSGVPSASPPAGATPEPSSAEEKKPAGGAPSATGSAGSPAAPAATTAPASSVPAGGPPPPAGPDPDPFGYGPHGSPPPPLPPRDSGASEQRQRDLERKVLVSRAEVGGLFGQGLDATDSATRAGGFYGGATYRVTPDIVLDGRYTFSSGDVVERLPGNQGGRFGVPNDLPVLESRHAFGVSIGYVAHPMEGPIRLFAVPLLGPRLLVLQNAVAPRWAFEAEFGGRAGIWASDAIEASVLLAYAPAMAKARDLADVQGSIQSELRFGVGTNVRATGRLGVSLAYEGDVITLEHQRVSSHGLSVGLSCALE